MAMTAESLRSLFGTERPVVGMVHFPSLPGTPLADHGAGMRRLLEITAADVQTLTAAGFDAVMFCNEGDRPYSLRAPLQAVAAMAAVISQVAPTEMPFGVDYLWDPIAAIAIAHATGAAFVREVFTGVYESDMGLWSPDPARILRYRREIGAEHIRLFMNVTPEFGISLGQRPVGVRARSAVVNGLADVILISGAMAGSEPEAAGLEDARCALRGDAPIFVNTGVTAATAAQYLASYDGVIVGTAIKVDGCTWNPVDPERACAFMAAAKAARGDGTP